MGLPAARIPLELPLLLYVQCCIYVYACVPVRMHLHSFYIAICPAYGLCGLDL